jgi:hypothetical protein
MYRLHLSSAYGFYNHLILKFQSEFNSLIQLDGFLDFPILSFEKTTNKGKFQIKDNCSLINYRLKQVIKIFLKLKLKMIKTYEIKTFVLNYNIM